MLSKPTANCWSESNSASLHQTQGASTPTSIADVEKEATQLGDLVKLLSPFVLSPDEKGKWLVMPKTLNPGNHDDNAPSTSELKQVRGNLREFAKAHKKKWGEAFVR